MPEYLEHTADKFTFRVATDRLYTREGFWVLSTDTGGPGRVRVGLTDFMQQHSGDMAFVETASWESDRARLLDPRGYLAHMQREVEQELARP